MTPAFWSGRRALTALLLIRAERSLVGQAQTLPG
jgi:hypothetical protein